MSRQRLRFSNSERPTYSVANTTDPSGDILMAAKLGLSLRFSVEVKNVSGCQMLFRTRPSYRRFSSPPWARLSSVQDSLTNNPETMVCHTKVDQVTEVRFFVTWFCYELIIKPRNKKAAPRWPDPYAQQVFDPLNHRLFWIDMDFWCTLIWFHQETYIASIHIAHIAHGLLCTNIIWF